MKQKFTSAMQASLALFACLLCIPLHSQTNISHEYNGLRIGDKQNKQQVEFFNAENSGECVIWDFSELNPIKRYDTELFCAPDSTSIMELGPNSINKYAFCTDSLLLVGYESPLKSINYEQPITLLIYPFEYGDTISASYSGKGTYCKTNIIESHGDMNVEADAIGTLILPGGDTLSNAIRVHSIRTGSIGIHTRNDSTELTSEKMKQEIEERYVWYIRGYRYPLLETVSTSYYANMDLVSCLQSAYYYSPDSQKDLTDTANENLQRADSIAENKQSAQDIIHYAVETDGNNIKITYSLEESANITAVICNHRGMTLKRTSYTMPAGDTYEINFNCTSLSPDMYILYINVNGKIYSEKIQFGL